MTEAFKQYAVLLKTLIRNINLRPKKNTEKPTAKMRIGKIGTIILIIFGAMAIGAYEVMLAMSFTTSAIKGGLTDEHLYMFLMVAQLVVFFFGVPTVMSNLYFSRDNALLATMPFRKGVVFSAKFTMAYLGELLISLLFVVPTIVTAGITSSVSGVIIPWYFYPTAIFAAFMSPVLPLLIITLVALPLMRVITVLKRNKLGYVIVMAIIYSLFLGVYFATVFGLGSFNSEEGLSASVISALAVLKKIGILNYPIVSVMTGVKPWQNLAIFVFGYLGTLAIAVILSFFFYERAVANTTESGAKSARHKEIEDNKSAITARSAMSAFMFKEFKTLLNTPTLFMSVILSMILPTIMMVFMRFTLASDDMGDAFGGPDNNMFLIGIITYLIYILSGTSNPVSSIGFSREGKNLPFLKSMPLSADVMVKTKLVFSMIISGLFSVIIAVAFPFATGIYNPIAIIGMFLLASISGFGSNCMMLYNDLKNPNYTWMNINEISKNNKRLLKPMLLNVGIGFAYMIIAIVLGILFGGKISEYAIYAIFYGITLIAPSVISVIYYGRLTAECQELFDKIGG